MAKRCRHVLAAYGVLTVYRHAAIEEVHVLELRSSSGIVRYWCPKCGALGERDTNGRMVWILPGSHTAQWRFNGGKPGLREHPAPARKRKDR